MHAHACIFINFINPHQITLMHLDKNLHSWLNLLGGFVSLWTNDQLHFVFHLQGRKVGTSLCKKKNKIKK